MSGYGVSGPDEGSGLLPWSWAQERLAASRNYWLASRRPDGRPHLMPVWGVWHEGGLCLSSSRESRKARNLRANPRCMISTEDAANPVVIEGDAVLVTEPAGLESILAQDNAKYGTDYGVELVDPALNSVFRIRPTWAFALRTDDFTGSPTRWEF
jgi:hypothetical protein